MATPKTPASATSSYLPAAEFLKRADARTVGQLCSDTEGITVTPTGLLTDPNLAAAMASASGELEDAIFVGQKYRLEDLNVLAATPCNAQARLFELLSDLTLGKLLKRRPNFQAMMTQGEMMQIAAAEEELDEIAQGTKIIAFLETMAAGIIDQNILTNDEITQRNLLVVQAERYFGIRADRSLPGGSTGITG